MNSIFLIELLLVFGAALVWAFYEYRTADRLSKQHREKAPQVKAEDQSSDSSAAGAKASRDTEASTESAADELSNRNKPDTR